MCRGGNGCHELKGLKVTKMPAWLIQKIYAEQYRAEVAEDHGQGTAEPLGARLRGLRSTFSAVGGWGHMSHASSGAGWGDTRSGDTVQRLQKKAQKIWEWLAMGGQGRGEEGTLDNTRMVGLGDWE